MTTGAPSVQSARIRALSARGLRRGKMAGPEPSSGAFKHAIDG